MLRGWSREIVPLVVKDGVNYLAKLDGNLDEAIGIPRGA